jgi:hypothetical protein
LYTTDSVIQQGLLIFGTIINKELTIDVNKNYLRNFIEDAIFNLTKVESFSPAQQSIK